MKTVLVVDDSKTIQTAVDWTLRGTDIQVLPASNQTEARTYIEKQFPDLILVDVGLNGEDGFAFCATLKSITTYASIPVVLMPSASEPIDLEQARTVGANAHIAKPFKTQDFLELVTSLLGLHQPKKTPLTYAGRLAQKRAAESGLGSPVASPTPAVPQSSPSPFSAPFSSSASAHFDEELNQDDYYDDDSAASPMEDKTLAYEADSEEFVGGPMLDPPPPPELQAARSSQVDVWSLTDEEERGPPTEENVLGHHRPPPPPPIVEAVVQPPPPVSSENKASDAAVSRITDASSELLARTHPAVAEGLSKDELREIAKEVIESIAWEVVPDLAETIIKEELRRLVGDTSSFESS